jgi:hypothetical protein
MYRVRCWTNLLVCLLFYFFLSIFFLNTFFFNIGRENATFHWHWCSSTSCRAVFSSLGMHDCSRLLDTGVQVYKKASNCIVVTTFYMQLDLHTRLFYEQQLWVVVVNVWTVTVNINLEWASHLCKIGKASIFVASNGILMDAWQIKINSYIYPYPMTW